MNTDYRTVIIFLPTADKSASWGEFRNTVRHLAGTVYEDKEATEDIMNNDPDTPSNCFAYNRELGAEEKKAITDACKAKGVIAFYLEGTDAGFNTIDNNTITLKED